MAGYDLLFSPVTSASLFWALDSACTRQGGKPAPKSLADKITDWQTDAVRVVGRQALTQHEHRVLSRNAEPPETRDDLGLADFAHRIVAVVPAETATWTRWNLLAEAERQLRPLRFRPRLSGRRHRTSHERGAVAH